MPNCGGVVPSLASSLSLGLDHLVDAAFLLQRVTACFWRQCTVLLLTCCGCCCYCDYLYAGPTTTGPQSTWQRVTWTQQHTGARLPVNWTSPCLSCSSGLTCAPAAAPAPATPTAAAAATSRITSGMHAVAAVRWGACCRGSALGRQGQQEGSKG